MDAANVDLKAFSDDFYARITSSHLQPVLDTLRYLKHETEVWFEITTLLIPGKNDSDQEITGNVHNLEGDTTFCSGCHAPLIVRDWHRIDQYRLTAAGSCPHCGTVVAGRFAAQAWHFGRRHIAIVIKPVNHRRHGMDAIHV